MTDWLELGHSIRENLNLCSQAIVTIWVHYKLSLIPCEVRAMLSCQQYLWQRCIFHYKKNSEVIPIMGRQLHH